MLAGWDITSRCNLSCIHCYNLRLYGSLHSQNLVLDLETEKVFKILDKLAEGRVNTIQFLGGEPFIRPDFIDILAYAKDNKLNRRIATNGVLLNKPLIEALALNCPEQIAFSIDGATPKSNDAIRGSRTFDRAVNNLKLLSTYFRDNNVETRIGIQCTLTRLNKYEIDKMVNLCKEFHLDFIGFEPIQILTRNVTQKNKLKEIILDSFELFEVGEGIASLASSSQNEIGIRMVYILGSLIILLTAIGALKFLSFSEKPQLAPETEPDTAETPTI